MCPYTLVKRNAALPDTVALIVQVINENLDSPYVQMVARTLSEGVDRDTFMRRTFDYVLHNVQYFLDKDGKELVLKPATTKYNGRGDCKKMTVMIADILEAGSRMRGFGITPLLKHIFYHHDEYTHIYPIVPTASGYVTLDVVDKIYNREVPASEIALANVYDIKGNRMDLYTGTIPGGSNNTTRPTINEASDRMLTDLRFVAGCRTMGQTEQNAILADLLTSDYLTMGARKKKTKEERKENRKKVFDKFKNVGLAPIRGAALGLMKLNAFNLAGLMARAFNAQPQSVEKLWSGLGGDVTVFKKTIIEGSKKPPFMATKASGTTGAAGAVATFLAAATPFMIKAKELFKSLKITKEGDPVDARLADALDEGEDLVTTDTVKIVDVKKDIADKSGKPDPDGGGGAPRAISMAPWANLNSWHGWMNAILKGSLLTAIPGHETLAGTIVAIFIFSYYVKHKFFYHGQSIRSII